MRLCASLLLHARTIVSAQSDRYRNYSA